MKIILSSTAVAAIFAATTLFIVSNDDSLSTLFEDNVEALADTESPDQSRPLGIISKLVVSYSISMAIWQPIA